MNRYLATFLTALGGALGGIIVVGATFLFTTGAKQSYSPSPATVAHVKQVVANYERFIAQANVPPASYSLAGEVVPKTIAQNLEQQQVATAEQLVSAKSGFLAVVVQQVQGGQAYLSNSVPGVRIVSSSVRNFQFNKKLPIVTSNSPSVTPRITPDSRVSVIGGMFPP